jgi:1-acyl-sn-glycerol-3-phosphate acyltransferase
MVKAEMADVKAVDYVIRHARLIPVERRNGHDAFALVVQRLRAGELIGTHPEATISRSLELREFKSGAARMASEAQVPLIPVIVWGAHRIWPKDHPKKVFRNKVPITVSVGRPIPPRGSVEQLNAALRQALNGLLYRVQEEYPLPGDPAGRIARAGKEVRHRRGDPARRDAKRTALTSAAGWTGGSA